MRRLLYYVLAAVAPAILAAAILFGSTPDEEEFRFAILTSTMHVRTLTDGTWAWWTSGLGLGIPQPLVPNFNMHPLVPLLAVTSPTTWVRLLYLAHTILGPIGMWQLVGALGLSRFVRTACVFTFMLASPTQNYLLADFWPTHYLVWTSVPWLLLFAWRFLEADGNALWRRSLLLGVTAGLVLANTNPGHIVVYGTVALAVLAARWRDGVARWRWAIAAAAIALAISSPSLVQLAAERTLFNEYLGIEKANEPLPPSAAWDVFLRPLRRPGGPPTFAFGSEEARTLFFGGPFAVLALAGLWFGRAHVDLVLGVLMTTPLLFTPLLPITFASRFHFRDPLILCAVPLAAVTLDLLWRSRATRPIAAVLLVVQIGVVSAAVDPYLAAMWEPKARQALWFRGATGETTLVDRLVALMPDAGRLAYSPQVDGEISARTLLPEGLGINALAFRGVSLVNGSFKGVSTDVLWPDDRLFYGRIRIPSGLIESDAGLDLLGVRYVLANAGEPVAPGLTERGTIAKEDMTLLVLYENTDAWPGAFAILGDERAFAELPMYRGCSHDRLLCKDLGVLAQRHHPLKVRVVRQEGRIDIALDGDAQPRLLILAEMFRPDWQAAADGVKLSTVSVGPGLLGVKLPPGAASVRVEYRPTLLRATTVMAWSVLAAALMVLLVLQFRNRWRRSLALR